MENRINPIKQLPYHNDTIQNNIAKLQIVIAHSIRNVISSSRVNSLIISRA